MPRGPLPNPDAQRRNEPTISAQALPAAGRQGAAPAVPEWRVLGEAGRAWWEWAWHTPQACAWPVGTEDFVARRAALEDDLRTLDEAPAIDLCELLDIEDSDVVKRLTDMVRRLHGLAGGRLAVMKEMRELDNRLGLNAKAMLDMRWKIDADGELVSAPKGSKAAAKRTPNRRAGALKVLSGGAAS